MTRALYGIAHGNAILIAIDYCYMYLNGEPSCSPSLVSLTYSLVFNIQNYSPRLVVAIATTFTKTPFAYQQ
jgi:hypothetical protein